jgi:hypothetical protein
MAALTITAMPVGGLSNATGFVAAAAGGDTIDGGTVLSGGVVLKVKNTNAATRDVTLADPRTTDLGYANPDTTVTVAATTGDVDIPVHPQYIDPATGLVNITYSAVTSLTVKVVRR